MTSFVNLNTGSSGFSDLYIIGRSYVIGTRRLVVYDTVHSEMRFCPEETKPVLYGVYLHCDSDDSFGLYD